MRDEVGERLISNDTIRRMVGEVDAGLPLLSVMREQAPDDDARFALTMAMDAGRLYRHRLKDLGHGGQFDTPEVAQGDEV